MFDRVQKNVELGYTPADIATGREIRAKVTNDMAVTGRRGRGDRPPQARARSGSSATAGAASSPGSRRTRLRPLARAVPYYGGGILDNAGIDPEGAR